MGASNSKLVITADARNRTSHVPRVSIGLPVYNGEPFVAKALDSILAQSFEDFELIVLDNASSDLTQEICLDYAKRDRRVRYFRNDNNIGAAGNFNRVFELSSGGEYFRWVSHNEWWDPEYLKQCVDVLDSEPMAVLCSCPITYYHDDGDIRASESGTIAWAEACTRAHGVTSSKALERFLQMLRTTSQIDPFYCLIRTNTLRMTMLHTNVRRAEEVLRLELSLVGPFSHLPERLVLRRRAPRRNEFQALKRIDPNYDGGIALPHWKQCYETLQVVKRARLTYMEKGYLMITVLKFFVTWHHDGMTNDLIRAAKKILHRLVEIT